MISLNFFKLDFIELILYFARFCDVYSEKRKENEGSVSESVLRSNREGDLHVN